MGKETRLQLEGKKFGKLQVVDYQAGKGWNVNCDCGKTTIAASTALSKGLVVSCGCSKKKRPYESLYNYFLRNAKYDIQLSYEEFLSLTNVKHCEYCGAEIFRKPFNTMKCGSYQLDRKDNRVGYTKLNTIVCCKECNYAKGNRYSYTEWKAMTGVLKEMRKTYGRGKEGTNFTGLGNTLPASPRSL